jgi:hypothetical protein
MLTGFESDIRAAGDAGWPVLQSPHQPTLSKVGRQTRLLVIDVHCAAIPRRTRRLALGAIAPPGLEA